MATEMDEIHPSLRNDLLETLMDTRCWHWHEGVES